MFADCNASGRRHKLDVYICGSSARSARALGPCGPGSCGLSWARVGRAPVGLHGPSWAGRLWASLVGQALVGPPFVGWAALVGPLVPCGPSRGACGPPLGPHGQVPRGVPLGPYGPGPRGLLWAGPVAPCWARMGVALMGFPRICKYMYIYIFICIYIYIYISKEVILLSIDQHP